MMEYFEYSYIKTNLLDQRILHQQTDHLNAGLSHLFSLNIFYQISVRIILKSEENEKINQEKISFKDFTSIRTVPCSCSSSVLIRSISATKRQAVVVQRSLSKVNFDVLFSSKSIS